MTKKELCEQVVKSYMDSHKLTKLDEKEVYYSSVLGVAMEYLGMIKSPEIARYISSRGGIVRVGECLTDFRTLLTLTC